MSQFNDLTNYTWTGNVLLEDNMDFKRIWNRGFSRGVTVTYGPTQNIQVYELQNEYVGVYESNSGTTFEKQFKISANGLFKKY